MAEAGFDLALRMARRATRGYDTFGKAGLLKGENRFAWGGANSALGITNGVASSFYRGMGLSATASRWAGAGTLVGAGYLGARAIGGLTNDNSVLGTAAAGTALAGIGAGLLDPKAFVKRATIASTRSGFKDSLRSFGSGIRARFGRGSFQAAQMEADSNFVRAGYQNAAMNMPLQNSRVGIHQLAPASFEGGQGILPGLSISGSTGLKPGNVNLQHTLFSPGLGELAVNSSKPGILPVHGSGVQFRGKRVPHTQWGSAGQTEMNFGDHRGTSMAGSLSGGTSVQHTFGF